MSKLVLIDGNSILNRAFYGIMGSKMLTTKDGKYTNAVYGFLAILFKVLEDTKPGYIAVAFDLKAPTARHKMYEGYKANRKGMPNELAEQMPIVKEILTAMNITIIEKETYEADDILGTLSKKAEKEGMDVVIVSGDRDTFQLASNKVTIRIPHTKVGKTEVDYFDEKAIIEKYGVKPIQLIEVKGLMMMAQNIEAEKTREYFKLTQDLFNKLKIKYPEYSLTELSMGMSNDYKIALEYGATMVRIGSSLFK